MEPSAWAAERAKRTQDLHRDMHLLALQIRHFVEASWQLMANAHRERGYIAPGPAGWSRQEK